MRRPLHARRRAEGRPPRRQAASDPAGEDAGDDLREAEPADADQLRNRHDAARRPRDLPRPRRHSSRRARDRRRHRAHVGARRRPDRRPNVSPRRARRARRARRRPGRERPHRPAPSLPGAGGSLHVARAPEAARRDAGRVRRRRQQRRALLARGGDPLSLHVRPRLPERLRARSGDSRRVPCERGDARDHPRRRRRRAQRRRRLYGRVDEHGPGEGGGGAARAVRRVSGERAGDAPRRARRARDALPACAPRRGDQRVGPRGPAVGRVRPGGEPAARAEGLDGVAGAGKRPMSARATSGGARPAPGRAATSGTPRLDKIVLAYSGGLDTSVILRWLIEEYGCEVVAFCADLGQGEELDTVRERATATGASTVRVDDLREEFARDFVFPILRANAVYEAGYLLGTSIARPLIAKRQVELARETGADAVAHGATGKGNDQVRFELTYYALEPGITVIAPWRTWDLSSRSSLI